MIETILMIKEFLPIVIKLWKGYISISDSNKRSKIARAIKDGNVESTKKILSGIIDN